ncbi:MAG TPA: hypothetical protein VLK37_02945 [Solirubrobacterales bacterium]|nr:hypothetical protein [Solirubrobacterales bacterium]
MDEPRDSATFRMAVAGLGLSLAIALIGICVILAFGPEEVDSLGGRVTVENHAPGALSGESPPTKTRLRPTEPKGRDTDTDKESTTDFTYSNSSSDGPAVPAELWLIVGGLFGALLGLLLPTPRWILCNCLLIVVLVILAVIALGIAIWGSASQQCVVAAGGAALAALFIPTPARYDRGET